MTENINHTENQELGHSFVKDFKAFPCPLPNNFYNRYKLWKHEKIMPFLNKLSEDFYVAVTRLSCL